MLTPFLFFWFESYTHAVPDCTEMFLIYCYIIAQQKVSNPAKRGQTLEWDGSQKEIPKSNNF